MSGVFSTMQRKNLVNFVNYKAVHTSSKPLDHNDFFFKLFTIFLWDLSSVFKIARPSPMFKREDCYESDVSDLMEQASKSSITYPYCCYQSSLLLDAYAHSLSPFDPILGVLGIVPEPQKILNHIVLRCLKESHIFRK